MGAALMLVASLTSGCSGSPRAVGNPALIAVVARARHDAVTETFRLRATIRRKDTTITLLADFGAGGLGLHAAPSQGEADVNGVRIAFISAHGHIWLRAPVSYWRQVARNLHTTLPATLLPTLGSTWVHITDSGALYAQIEPLTDKGAILGVGLPTGTETTGYQRLRQATVAGRPASVWVQRTLHRTLVFARPTGALLEVRAPGGSLTISGYGAAATPRPPAHSVAGSGLGV